MRKKRLLLLGAAALLAGLPWVTGAPILVLHPWDVSGTVSLTNASGTAIQLNSLQILAAPHASSWWSDDVSTKNITPLVGPPYSWTITLDGGDPLIPDNPGHQYKFGMSATLEAGSGDSSNLWVKDVTAVDVITDVPGAPVTLPVSTLRRIHGDVTVTNGHLEWFQIQFQHTGPGGLYYEGSIHHSFSAGENMTSWVNSMWVPPLSNVWAYGYVGVIDSAGNRTQISLAGAMRDVSAGDGVISWTVDASPTSGFDGTVSATLGSNVASSVSHQISVHGTSSSNSGVSVWMPVANDAAYSVRVPPGSYESYVYTTTSGPWGNSYGEPSTDVVPPDTVLQKSWSFPLRKISLPLVIDGFYDNESISSGQLTLARMRWSGSWWHWAWGGAPLIDDLFQVPVSDGNWKPYSIYVSVQQAAELGYSQVVKQFLNEEDLPQVELGVAALDHDYPESRLTLIESKVFMDVSEPDGEPQMQLSNPSARAVKVEYNADSSQRYLIDATASRTQAATDLASLTLVAEPGEYTLDAKVIVNGTTVAMPESTIVFGQPMGTPPGGQTAVWTPDAQQDLQVALDFGGATSGGISTVVKTEQGPTVPEGFSTLCSPNQDNPDACPTLYYDIRTNVEHTGPVEVCIRQAYTAIAVGELGGVLDALGLYHFKDGATCNAHLPPQDPASCWERLGGPLPSGKPLVTDCSLNLAACGCANALDCGIAQGVNVIQLCGLTNSFSPFTVLKVDEKVFNATGSGATGTIQSWQVPRAGVYRVTAIGAKGGAATGSPQLSGGCGAKISGEIALAHGDTLQVLVGQKGQSTSLNAGGGGGSFVVRSGQPLIVAGGGGGVRHAATVNGRDASLTTSGGSGSTSPSYASGFVAGGTNGRGGSRAADLGSGGGGWTGNGTADGARGEGGFAFNAAGGNGGRGGRGLACDGPPFADGGFGGGGAGNGCHGGGGGGGYSGGGGGRVAGGGGSWKSGANQQGSIQCLPGGNGRVELEWLRP